MPVIANAHPIIDREEYEEHEKYLFLPLWKYRQFTHDSVRPLDRWVTVKKKIFFKAIAFWFQWCLTNFRECFKQRIVWKTLPQITKSSMKPWCDATANQHLCSSAERNGEQRQALVEPWCKHWNCWGWQKGMSRDKVTRIREEIRPVALAISELCLSKGIRLSVRQSDSNLVQRFRADLKTFLAAKPILPCCHKLNIREKFLGQKPPWSLHMVPCYIIRLLWPHEANCNTYIVCNKA